MSDENIMRMWNDCSTGGKLRPKVKITAKTSAYTITPDDFGTMFTTRGATAAVTFTLPTASAVNKDEWVLFYNVADYNMKVSGTANGLVTFNDAAANSVAFVTASEKIGGAFLAISDGTSWLILTIAQELQSMSVDTSPSSSPSATPSSSPSAT